MSQSDLTHAFHIAYTEDRVRKLKSDIIERMQEIELLKGDKGDSVKGDKGDSVKGDKGDKGDSIKGDKGDKGDSVKGDKGDSIKGDKGDKGDTPDIEAKFEEALAQFNDKLNSNQKLVKTNTDTMLSNVQKQLSTLGGGGSYKILDNADVEKTKLSSVAGDSILVYDPTKKLFVVTPFLSILERLRAELEVQYDKLIDETDATAHPHAHHHVGSTFVGEAAPGSLRTAAVWRIKRIYELADNQIEIIYANGSADFDKVWDDRLTYTFD